MFKKILKFLLVVVIWLLIAVVLITASQFIRGQGEEGLFLFLAIFALWYGVKLGRKLYHRHQAKKRVRQLVNVEEPVDEEDSGARRFGFWRRPSGLEKDFRQLISSLHRTELSRHGDPLYVLPWFAVVGSGEGGLNELVEQTRLPSPTIDITRAEENDSGIDWHLYNQGVMLTTPQRFLEGEASTSDPDWLALLGLLSQHRTREPLNGLVVALPVTEILENDTQSLLDRAQKARRLIEDSVQVLGVKVPVYLMVTGLENVQGVDHWLGQLADGQLRQAMGRINEKNEASQALVDQTLESIARRVRQMNLESIRGGDLAPELMGLPMRFREMAHALRTFAAALVQENPYQKTPELRGLYFTAKARRGNHEISAFAHEFFGQILPMDRARVTPLGEWQRKRDAQARRHMMIGAGAAGLALFALAGLYLHDRNDLQDQLAAQQQLQAETDAGAEEELASVVRALQRDLELIESLEERRWTPWMSNVGGLEFVERMKTRFVSRVHEELIQPIDEDFAGVLDSEFFSREFDPEDARVLDAVGTYTTVLVRRINLHNARLDGARADSLRNHPMPYEAGEISGVRDEQLEIINALYVQALIWREDDQGRDAQGETQVRRDDMVATLERILQHSDHSLEWVIHWVNDNPNYPSVRLSDFWDAGSRQIEADVQVAGAFTLEGKDAIEMFIEEMQLAAPDAQGLQSMVPEFFQSYREQYLGAWETFARNFNKGLTRLADRREHLGYVNNLSTGRNLYFTTIDLIYDQIWPFLQEEDQEMDDWLFLYDYYNDMVSLEPDDEVDTGARDRALTKLALKTVGSAGPLGKTIAKRGKKGMKTKRKLDAADGGPSVSERMMRLEEAADLLSDYREAINDFVFNAEIASVSYSNMRERFESPDNPGQGSGALASAYSSIRELQGLIGKPDAQNRAFWNMLLGPLELIEKFAMQEAACHFNDEYRNSFLANLENVSEYRKARYAYGDNGALWDFIDDVADPFIRREFGAGYVRRRAGDLQFPVTSDFLEYVSRAQDQRQREDSYDVMLEARPTQTNLDALHQVEETRLRLQCPEGSSTLVNRNFPNDKTFEWNEECGDAILRLRLGSLELQKTYEGPNGFPEFLDDLRSGRKRFEPSDFPRHREQLREYGVSHIDVRYDMSGHRALLRLFDTQPSGAPSRATGCWSNSR